MGGGVGLNSDKSEEENKFVSGKKLTPILFENQSKNLFTSNQHSAPQKVNTRESVRSDNNSHVLEESYDGNSSHQEES